MLCFICWNVWLAKDQDMNFEKSNILLNVNIDNSQLPSNITRKIEAEPTQPAVIDKVNDSTASFWLLAAQKTELYAAGSAREEKNNSVGHVPVLHGNSAGPERRARYRTGEQRVVASIKINPI